jgi:hypothetical protein
MSIIECIQNSNLDCLQDWAVSGAIWWLLFDLILLGVLLKFLIAFISGFVIAIKLLKRNRYTKGNGYGTEAADLFIELWYHPQPYEKIRTQSGIDGSCSRHLKIGTIAQNELIEPKLIEFYTDMQTNQKMAKAIKNSKNRVTFRLIQFCLIHITGDNPDYYKDLKKHQSIIG